MSGSSNPAALSSGPTFYFHRYQQMQAREAGEEEVKRLVGEVIKHLNDVGFPIQTSAKPHTYLINTPLAFKMERINSENPGSLFLEIRKIQNATVNKWCQVVLGPATLCKGLDALTLEDTQQASRLA